MAAWLMAAVQAGLAAHVALHGPDGPLPMHFDARGEVDRWGDRYEAVAVLLGLSVLTLALQCFMRHTLLGAGAADRGAALPQAVGRCVLLVALAGATLLATALGLGRLQPGPAPVSMMHWALALGWVPTAGLGVVIGQARPQGRVGLHVHWTRHSRPAWEQAHRVLGQVCFLGGLAGVLLTPLLDPATGFALLPGLHLAGLAASLYEGWRAWRRDPQRSG
ncbi:SdpI family protein [Eleftheria terrae]|uniref:SdpI family protein n=1 Tax=Eleftheria terrae TaxID=1597781 RepID=UPI00263AD441|nr:hypothetical protein [Eleftheria terrae]WKB51780.1 hypothetical protein N7L95_18530 [Eleftheria terrae]